jgi:uncharacterized protein
VAIESQVPEVPGKPVSAPTDLAPPVVAPVARSERISSVDVLRGVALLGILLMNIQSFGSPGAADDNPRLGKGGDNPANVTCWMVNQVLFEGKMRTIFSMLFGAGVIILTSRAEKRGAQAEIADIYYRRTIWLLVFGLVHAYFLWDGDILFYYGAVGLLLFPLRKLRPIFLITGGLLLLAVVVPKAFLAAAEAEETRRKGEEAEIAAKAGEKLTKEQQAAKDAFAEQRKRPEPDDKEIQEEIADHRGGYWTLFPRRARAVAQAESTEFYQTTFYDVAGMMLIGMGLMKLGVFSASRSTRFYRYLTLLGYGIGVPLNLAVGIYAVRNAFNQSEFDGLWMIAYHPGRLSVALGHIGLLMLICKAGYFPAVTSRLAAVGQMALSNYFLQTVVCCLFFNGYGWGWFGYLQRYELLYVVFAVWAIQLLLSSLWLRFFQFGPMEWLWRSLTYWRLQPMLVTQDRLAPTGSLA